MTEYEPESSNSLLKEYFRHPAAAVGGSVFLGGIGVAIAGIGIGIGICTARTEYNEDWNPVSPKSEPVDAFDNSFNSELQLTPTPKSLR